MRIGQDVEQVVRSILLAVIAEDADELKTQVDALVELPEQSSVAEGVRLAAAVSIHALIDLFERVPTADEMRTLSEDLANDEPWLDVTSTEIETLLRAFVEKRQPDGTLPPERVAVLSFFITASLLSAGHNDDEKWWQYLDRIEAAIEAAPN